VQTSRRTRDIGGHLHPWGLEGLTVVEGDHEVFADLLKPYERMIYVTALSVLGNEADVEEAAQEAILKAAVPRFRKESKFSTWLVQIVINESKMKLRNDRRR
jgi:RNA polymerase sigma-70 factor (ECF subfamily)